MMMKMRITVINITIIKSMLLIMLNVIMNESKILYDLSLLWLLNHTRKEIPVIKAIPDWFYFCITL